MASSVVTTKNLNNCDSMFFDLEDLRKCHLGCKTFLIWDRTSATSKCGGPTETKKCHLVVRCASSATNSNYSFSFLAYFIFIFI